MDNKKTDNDENKFAHFLTKQELLDHAFENTDLSKDDHLEKLSTADMQKIIHDLRVHQTELEMQNEQLRWAQRELDKSRERYFDLYELAPIGYFSINEMGTITESNLTLSIILGELRSNLIQQPFSKFIHPEDRNNFFIHLKTFFEANTPEACIWVNKAIKKNGQPFWIRIDATRVVNDDGVLSCRGVMINITDMKTVEEELYKRVEELQKYH